MNADRPARWLLGEGLGTFLLVFFGCGSVCAAVLHGAQVGIFQVAIVWGLGIAVAIYLTAPLSGAHLNPAVTLALAVFAGFPRGRVAGYMVAQLAGAFVAAAVLYLVFSGSLSAFEARKGIVRGQPGSEASAMVFGEFFPNPGGEAMPVERDELMPMGRAFAVEAIGTAVLMFVILGLTDGRNTAIPAGLAPVFIGLTVTLIISLFGPLTMAGLNPARDLGPRIFSSLAGWGHLPFTANGWGWLVVYIVAPITGALVGGALKRLMVYR
ncbi:MAG: MIP/aquaporin family protein [Terrimicrobiaceae bacterium]